jgi:hypothetical protein
MLRSSPGTLVLQALIVVLLLAARASPAHAQAGEVRLPAAGVAVTPPPGSGAWRLRTSENNIDKLTRDVPAAPLAGVNVMIERSFRSCDGIAASLPQARPPRLGSARFDARAKVEVTAQSTSAIMCAPVPEGLLMVEVVYFGDLASDDAASITPFVEAILDAVLRRAAPAAGPLRLARAGLVLQPPAGDVRWSVVPGADGGESLEGIGPMGPTFRAAVSTMDGSCPWALGGLGAVNKSGAVLSPAPARIGPEWHPEILFAQQGAISTAHLCLELPERALVLFVTNVNGPLDLAEPLVAEVLRAARATLGLPTLARGSVHLRGFDIDLELPAGLTWKVNAKQDTFWPVGPGAPRLEISVISAFVSCPVIMARLASDKQWRYGQTWVPAGWKPDVLAEPKPAVDNVYVCSEIGPSSQIALVRSIGPLGGAEQRVAADFLSNMAIATGALPPPGFMAMVAQVVVLTPDDAMLDGSWGATVGMQASFTPRRAFDMAGSVNFDIGGAAGGLAFDLKSGIGAGTRLGPLALGVVTGFGLDGYGVWGDDFRVPFGAYLLLEGRAWLALGRLTGELGYGVYPRTGVNETRFEARVGWARPDRSAWYLGVRHTTLDDEGDHGTAFGVTLGWSPPMK